MRSWDIVYSATAPALSVLPMTPPSTMTFVPFEVVMTTVFPLRSAPSISEGELFRSKPDNFTPPLSPTSTVSSPRRASASSASSTGMTSFAPAHSAATMVEEALSTSTTMGTPDGSDKYCRLPSGPMR
jgi:hypothetical protein